MPLVGRSTGSGGPDRRADEAPRRGDGMLDLIIRGGQVVTPQGVGVWDVGVEGERIAAVAAPGSLPADGARVVDATGQLVIPGGIDPHVHTHWPIPALGGGHTTSAPPEQVSRAAIHGGTTTLVDFAVWEQIGRASCRERV